MKPGDRVRPLREKEEGTVTRILDKEKAEVEIEEGFAIPYLISELVVVEDHDSGPAGGVQDEKEVVAGKRRQQHNREEQETIDLAKGVYMAFVPVSGEDHKVLLINHTGYTLLAGLGEERNGTYKKIFTGAVAPESAVEAGRRSTADFERWPPFVLSGMLHCEGPQAFQEPFTRKMKFTAGRFTKAWQPLPLIDEEGYLFRIDQDNVSLDPAQLKERMMEGEPQPDKEIEHETPEAPSSAVDLHIDMLVQDYRSFSNSEALELQLDTFRKALDGAIVNNMESVTFIHGVGNGTLRHQIHKELSGRNDIRYFKDAQWEKYGYGATYVQIN